VRLLKHEPRNGTAHLDNVDLSELVTNGEVELVPGMQSDDIPSVGHIDVLVRHQLVGTESASDKSIPLRRPRIGSELES
jgi:hypothetical protein